MVRQIVVEQGMRPNEFDEPLIIDEDLLRLVDFEQEDDGEHMDDED